MSLSRVRNPRFPRPCINVHALFVAIDTQIIREKFALDVDGETGRNYVVETVKTIEQ